MISPKKLEQLKAFAKSLTKQGQGSAMRIEEYLLQLLDCADQFATEDDALDNMQASLEDLKGWADTALLEIKKIREDARP